MSIGFMDVVFGKCHSDTIVQLPAELGQKPPAVNPVTSLVFLVQIQHIFQEETSHLGFKSSNFTNFKILHKICNAQIVPVIKPCHF